MKVATLVISVAIAFVAGWFSQQHLGTRMLTMDHDREMASMEEPPLYWVAPMDPNYRRDKPGKSPMGMDLVPVYETVAEGQQQDGGVTISTAIEHNLGVRTELATQGPFELAIEAVGAIAFNEDRLVHVHSRVEGWIEKAYVSSVGEAVKKGQKLFELYSPQLVSAQEEYLAALRSNNQTLQQASRARLRSLGLNSAQIRRLEKRRKVSQRITHYAAQKGVIASLGVRQGMFIRPSLELMSIGALEEVWLIAEVFERQAGWIKIGQTAEISVPALPGQTRTATVDYIYPVLDQQSRTLRIRLRFPNSDLLLKPNMFADVTLSASVGEQVVSIPREAVIRSGSHNRVVVSEGSGRYRPAFVTPGVESNGRLQILEGLKAGDRVVTSAQFLLDSESKIDVALAALEAKQQPQAMPDKVMATGRIETINTEQGMVTITHDPIEAWQWPKMKMDFNVDSNVATSQLRIGQRVAFEITKEGDWDYLVSALQPVEPSASGSVNASQGSTRTVLTQGEIKEVLADAGMLSIVHDAIPQWQWPVMSMMFSVADDQSFTGLSVGQKVSFELTENEQGDYIVANIKLLK